MTHYKISEADIEQMSREFSEKFSEKLRKSGDSAYWEHEDRIRQMLKSFLKKRLEGIASSDPKEREALDSKN